ncbi:MAG: twin-arginine translocase subunit TatC [Thermoanaerobaculia bacterium]
MSAFNPREILEGRAGRSPESPEDELPRMGFFQHLEELRKRLIVSLIAIFVGFLAAWAWAPEIFDFLARPIRTALPQGQNLAYTTLTEPFLMYFRVALLAGILVSSPVVLWQLWLFISPALYRREKRYVVPFVTFGVLFFLSGCAFAYYEAFPLVVRFLIGVGQPFQAVITINEYLSMATKLILGLGLCFETPILVFFLARLGIVSERWLLKKFKYAVLIIFIIAAVITPTPDVATQCVFALPMIALYLLGVLIAWLFRRREPETGNP